MNYKISKFIFVTNTKIHNNYNLVYSTRTRKMLLFPTEFINRYKNGNFSFNELDQSLIDKMIDSKIIVPDEEDELSSILSKNKENQDKNRLLYSIIMPTAECNLNCKYCGQLNYNKILPEKYDEHLLKRIDILQERHNFKKHKVGWFGGEPLLGINRIEDLSRKISDLSHKKGIQYSAQIATNGLLLNVKNYRKLKTCNVDTIELTIDGPEEIHDKRKPTVNGKRSYNTIMKNLKDIFNEQEFQNNETLFSLRCNLDSSNYEYLPDLIEEFEKNDILNNARFYIAPLFSWGNNMDRYSLSRKEFANLEVNIINYLKNNGFKSMDLIPHYDKTTVCTLTNKTTEVLDPEGCLFKCTETPLVPFYENKQFKIGHIKNYNDNFQNICGNKWYSDLINSKFPCSDCNFFPICGGACPRDWYDGREPCPAFISNFEDRLIIQYYNMVNNQ